MFSTLGFLGRCAYDKSEINKEKSKKNEIELNLVCFLFGYDIIEIDRTK